MTRKPRAGKPPDVTGSESRRARKPVFAQPQPTPDPKEFEVKHPSDNPCLQADRRLETGNTDWHRCRFPRRAICRSRG